jgi:hypothetical protein
VGVVPGTTGERAGDRASVARHLELGHHDLGGESAHPGPTGTGRDAPRIHAPDNQRGRTKEAATTHPTPTNHLEPDPAPPTVCRAVEHVAARPRWLTQRPPVLVRRLALAAVIAFGLLVAVAPPAFAAGGSPTLSGVISNLTNWIVGILAGVATLFLTIGGLRYLTAGGDPGQVEKAKIALKSACIGYALAILAPLLVSILASLVGG